MAKSRLEQIWEKRALIKRELLLSRQLDELDDEERAITQGGNTRLYPQTPFSDPTGTLESTEHVQSIKQETSPSRRIPIIDLTDSPEPEDSARRDTVKDEPRTTPEASGETLREEGEGPALEEDQSLSATQPTKRASTTTKNTRRKRDEDYGAVVRAVNSDFYVELRCHLCGANCRPDQLFFQKEKGLMMHYRMCHPDFEKKMTPLDLAQQCAYRKLTAADVAAMHRGDVAAYSVQKSTGDKSKQRGYCPALDEKLGRSITDQGAAAPIMRPSEDQLEEGTSEEQVPSNVDRSGGARARKTAPNLGFSSKRQSST